MQMRLRMLLNVLVVTAASTILVSSVMAQTDPSDSEPIRLETIPDTVNEAFFNDSGDFYLNRSLLRQANYMLGFGSVGSAGFPDLEIERDADLLNRIYNDVLDQQVSSDPVIRTPDLPNPFNTSVLRSPAGRSLGNRIEGSEFIFETVPPR